MTSVLRWTLRAGATLLFLLLILVGVLYWMGSRAAERTYAVAPRTAPLPSDAPSLTHGKHVAHVLGCYDCHGDRLQGAIMADAPPFRISAPNLTPAGIGRDYSVTDWYRAIRHGVNPEGRPLSIMPSSAYSHLSDRDAAALIAYLQTIEPVASDVPPTQMHALGRILTAVGAFDPTLEMRETISPAPSAPAWDASLEFGRYLTRISCQHCHGPDLQGQQSPAPDAPYAPGLATSGQWPFDTFSALMRTGRHPSGRQLDPKHMPWTAFRHHTEAELRGLHAYLRSLPDVPVASR